MKQESQKTIPDFDINPEDFDCPEGYHKFSEEYNERKRLILKKISGKKEVRFRILRLAVAMCLVLVGTPVVVNAATKGDLFARLFGSKGHRNVEVHTEVFVDDKYGLEIPITYPEREYVEVDQEKAAELLKEDKQFEPYSFTTRGGTTITVDYVVSDGNAAVLSMILENKDGLEGFVYDQLNNESKGAWFSNDSRLSITIGSGQLIYVDIDNSTPERAVCYVYSALAYSDYEGRRSFPISIIEYPCSKGEFFGYEGYQNTYPEGKPEKRENTQTERHDFLVSELQDKASFSGAEGEIEISPISMKVAFYEQTHMDNTYSVRIAYRDGTEYDVWERSWPDHENDKYIDNTGYIIGDGYGGGDLYIFNRLVDVDGIEAIYINDVEYTRCVEGQQDKGELSEAKEIDDKNEAYVKLEDIAVDDNRDYPYIIDNDYKIEMVSYEIIPVGELNDHPEYSVEDYSFGIDESGYEGKFFFDRIGISKESDVTYRLYGPESYNMFDPATGEMDFDDYMTIYANNQEEVDMYIEKNKFYYNADTDYYFVRMRITNSSGQKKDDKYNISSIQVVLSDGNGGYLISGGAGYVQGSSTTIDSAHIMSFYELDIEPGESKVVTVGFPVFYDERRGKVLQDKNGYTAYVGKNPYELVNSGANPEDSQDMVSLDNVVYGK